MERPGGATSPLRAALGLQVPRQVPVRAPSLRCRAGIQERTAQLRAQWDHLQSQCQEQEERLRELLALAERFWHGLAELALTLSDTQQLVLGLEEAGGEPEAIRARLRTMQVWAAWGACWAAPRHGQSHGIGSAMT